MEGIIFGYKNHSMPVQTEQWEIFELTLQGQVDGNPFVDVSLQADFIQGERQVTVDGFYDGDGLFKLRFMPDQEGLWQYRTRSNLAAMDGRTGEMFCMPAGPGNHGPVRVAHACGTSVMGVVCFAAACTATSCVAARSGASAPGRRRPVADQAGMGN